MARHASPWLRLLLIVGVALVVLFGVIMLFSTVTSVDGEEIGAAVALDAALR